MFNTRAMGLITARMHNPIEGRKSKGGKRQGRERKKKEDQKRKNQKKEDAGAKR